MCCTLCYGGYESEKFFTAALWVQPKLQDRYEEGRTIAFFLSSGHSTVFLSEGWGGQWAKGAASREQTEKHVREEGGLSATE